MTTEHELHAELRSWAAGLLPLVAATEMLIRAGYARPGSPWVKPDGDRHWIDFAAIPDLIGGKSGGEQRYLRIASSLGTDVPIVLNDEIPGLDYTHAQLVIAAIAHSAGFHEPSTTFEPSDTGEPSRRRLAPLVSWPDSETPG